MAGELTLEELGPVRWDRLTICALNALEEARSLFEAGEIEQLGAFLAEHCDAMAYALETHPDYTPWPFSKMRDGHKGGE